MPQCEGTTKKNERCRNLVPEGTRFCYAHDQNKAGAIFASAVGGAMIGSMFAPGTGAVVGGLIGAFLAAMAGSETKR
jgi:outer membrane lipoprotein SlyB